jgi:NAD(P)-dependent dehydrogenase (short-subunit alcohol dehydrogenase family)
VSAALVTGADRGLGHALAAALAARGHTVWAACLGTAPTLAALGVHVIEGVDVTSEESLRALPVALGSQPLALVISNAGINESSGGPWDADTAAMARELDVNLLGAIRVVKTLLPNLASGARIGFVSTGRGASAHDPDPANAMNYGYRISKGALNVYGALLAQDLRPRGIAVALLNPGPIDTDLMRRMAAAGKSSIDPATLPSPEDVAPHLLDRLDELTLERSGRWIGADGTEIRA